MGGGGAAASDNSKEDIVKKEEKLSSHVKPLKRSNTQTENIKKEVLSEKYWYMRGGEDEKDLPSNSLLESKPKFKSASKANPIITQEHTSTIENIIKLIVLGENWYNVIPRALPVVGSRKGEDDALGVSQ